MISVEIPELTTIVVQLAIIAAMLLATALVARLISAILRKLLFKVPPLLNEQIARGASIFVWLVGLLLVVNQLGLNLDILLLLIALAGIATIIATRDVLGNMASRYLLGSFIPVKVGDDVQVAGQRGRVIEINQVTSLLLSDDGSVITVPNSVFIKEICINLTPYASQRVSIPILVPGGVSLPEAETEVLKLCNKYRNRLDQRFPPLVTVKHRGQSEVEMELILLVAQPERRDELVAELSTRIAELIDRMKGSHQ
ncbi:MAG: mechanosensitive ion channel family protein [Nitrososphaerota archaeon]